jgi:hypothetical protein
MGPEICRNVSGSGRLCSDQGPGRLIAAPSRVGRAASAVQRPCPEPLRIDFSQRPNSRAERFFSSFHFGPDRACLERAYRQRAVAKGRRCARAPRSRYLPGVAASLGSGAARVRGSAIASLRCCECLGKSAAGGSKRSAGAIEDLDEEQRNRQCTCAWKSERTDQIDRSVVVHPVF